MRMIYLLLLGLSLPLMSCSQEQTSQKENGWYYIIDEQQDSVSQEPIVTAKDFVELNLIFDSFGKPFISGKVSKDKLEKWADATEKSIGKRIGFVFNDTVITAPQVNARIESGNFQISNPSEYDLKRVYRQLLKEKANSTESFSEAYFHEQKASMMKYKSLFKNG